VTSRFQPYTCRFPLLRKTVWVSCALLLVFGATNAQTELRPISLSILDFGNSAFAPTATGKIREGFKTIGDVTVLDPELTRAAAKGVGYIGSLNMMLSEARDLGVALSSEFYLIGDAQTLRRSSSETPIFFESYCSIFVISSRTGRLVSWDRLSANSSTSGEAEQKLIGQLAEPLLRHLIVMMRRAQQDDQIRPPAPLIEQAPDDEKAAEALGLRLPRPFRRLRPDYPMSAAKADAEATVDVLVDVRADGEVDNVEVVRWAGFGLDEATIATVRQLHFFPAMKNGTPIPLRVLLRYNFRKPATPQRSENEN